MKKILVALACVLLVVVAAVWAQNSVVVNPLLAGDTQNLRRITVTLSSGQFLTAGTTSDVTVVVLPPRSQIVGVMADLTTTFACTETCTTATLSMTLGTSAGGSQVLASFDADAAAAQFGDADAELGTGITRAAAIQGGLFGTWATATTISLRLTSGTGNIGTGTATNLSQGAVTIVLLVRSY